MPNGRKWTADEIAAEKTRILTIVEATLDYIEPSMLSGSYNDIPWLEKQLSVIHESIGLDDINPFELVVWVGLGGPIYSRTLSGEPPKGRTLRAAS